MLINWRKKSHGDKIRSMSMPGSLDDIVFYSRVHYGAGILPSDFPSILSFVPRPSGQNVYRPVRFPGPDSPSKRRDVEPWITILREDLPRMHTTSDIPSPSELKAFTRLAFESADFSTIRRIRIDYFDFDRFYDSFRYVCRLLEHWKKGNAANCPSRDTRTFFSTRSPVRPE